MRRLGFGLLCVLFLTMALSAQTAAKKDAAPAKKPAAAPAGPPMPKPAAELSRLAYYAGDWKTEGKMEASDMGPGGAFSSTDHYEWFPGKFFLVSHSNGTMAGMGTMKEMAVFGYNAEKKLYTYHGINSMGEDEISTGTVSGSDWTWLGDSPMNGKVYKGKFMVHEESPTSYTMKFDMSADGGKTWKTAMTGKATKTSK